jgi:hypothetical protein
LVVVAVRSRVAGSHLRPQAALGVAHHVGVNRRADRCRREQAAG